MRRTDFHFDLPEALIAQSPPARRSGGRLLWLNGADGTLGDARVIDLPRFLRRGDLMIFNDTRVLPARLRGSKLSGGRVEVLVERCYKEDAQTVLAHVRASKAPGEGVELRLAGNAINAEVVGRDDDLFRLRLSAADGSAASAQVLLAAHGKVPLPPYIKRAADARDSERYQTVYAREPGAVAAPTAGLHFDPPLLRRLEESGVEQAFLTLHVGAGTFQPVRAEHVEEHVMHGESVHVSEDLVSRIHDVRARGGRIIAVGTTVVRSLETAAMDGELQPFHGESRLFIYPGFDFRVVDAMLTNFHLPESSLLMLVSAFAGRRQVLTAYRYAVRQRYRFFSYGDAMLIWPRPGRADAV